MLIQGCSKEVSKVQESFKGASCFKEDWMWICRSFNCVRELEGISKKFKGVSSKLQVCFRGVSRVFQSFFHEVTRLNRVSRSVKI